MDIIAQHFIDSGIPVDTLILLLMLPIIATLVVVARHIIGIKSFGMYIPIIATYALATLGFKIGIILIIYLSAVGILTRYAISILRIHYISRLSLVICISTIASIAFLYLMTFYDGTQGFAKQNALPIILIISLCETFVSTQIQKGFRTALYLFVETLVIAILGYLLISWDVMRNFILDFPYIVIVTVLVNILIGKWKGLRLYEVWRFRTVKKTAVKKV